MRSVLLIIFLCMSLHGCSDEADPLRIGSNRWLGYAPLYIADDLRWLAPSGFRLLEYSNTGGVLRAFRNGLLDVALLTLDETLRLQANGYDLEILLVTNISSGADVLYALPPVEGLDDLQGRRIGVEDSALGAFFLARLLDQAGLKLGDVDIFSLAVHQHLDAMRTQQVDAVVTFASQGPELAALGALPLIDSRAFPNEIIDVIVADRQRVSPEARRRLQALWYESLQFWSQRPEYADRVLYRRLALSPAELETTRTGLLMGDPSLNRQLRESGQLLTSLRWAHDYQLDRNLLPRAVNYANLLSHCEGHPC